MAEGLKSQVRAPRAGSIGKPQDHYAGWILLFIAVLGPIAGVLLRSEPGGFLVAFQNGTLVLAGDIGKGFASGSYTLPLAIFGLAALFFPIRNPQDFYGAAVLMAAALFALWASSDLTGIKGFQFGPGTAPRMFAILLGAMSLVIMLTGLFTHGPALQRYAVRGPFFVVASILFFAVAIRPLGLVFTSFLTIMISAAASDEVRWTESVIWSAALTLFCALLFPKGLGLPLQLWPDWLMRLLGM